MNNFILEIGTEEIPSLYIDNIVESLEKDTKKILEQLHVDCHNIYALGTPRRLVVFIEGISSQQEDIVHKIKGPSLAVAFEKDGKPQNAVIKFAQANQVKIEDLLVEKTNKGQYIFAQKIIKGKRIELLLPEICLNLITNISLPKSMRWGTTSLRFIRPIRWLLALYNNQIISFQLHNLTSGRKTYGHRLLSPGMVKIPNASEYFNILKERFVICDAEIRKKEITSQIKNIIKNNNGKEYVEPSLLEEVKNLVEYPKVLLGKFDEKYLDLPKEVLTAVMIKHQKYFPIYNNDDSLLPFFLVVINGNQNQYIENIIRGNERVLKARLEDAKFFFQEDQKIAKLGLKPLEGNIEKLKNIIFQENLGTIYDKVERLITLSQKIGEDLRLNENSLQILKRAAQICKSDLVSEMVKEFPELQGIMGREYALLQGEAPAVATTIFEHYLPRFSGDNFPKTITGSILSIVDKLDNIIACFLNNIIPDGSQDPYALRRQALGIINIVLLHNLEFSLSKIINLNINLLRNNKNLAEQKVFLKRIDTQDIKYFIFQRFRFLLLERGFKYDIIDAVLAINPDSILDILARIKAIQNIYHTSSFTRIITAATRAFNLSRNITELSIDNNLFQEQEEVTLYLSYLKVRENVTTLIAKHDYITIFTNLAQLNKPIDNFFDKVLVMVKEERVRHNRLALLKSIANLYNTVADLTKIALSKGGAN